ncbi:MAG: ABC transporter substrate-binding protein, partial [Oscillospiraceae bacterium]|nr:ABC transporter substrate-binding protein [Oscillospiraceae bacterium]
AKAPQPPPPPPPPAAATPAAATTTAAATTAATEATTAAATSSLPTGTYKIGGTGPLTGGAAIYGMSVKQGAELAVEEINALGGIQFELNYQDDEHDAEKAVNAYNTLKDWGIQISFSSVTSTPAVATIADAYRDRLFGLTPSASSTAVTEGNDNIYQMCFADPNQGMASAQYIYNKQLGEKIAVIYKNDDVYSKGIYETFEVMANELGLDIVSVTTFTEDSQSDFSVQIADARNNGADFIFLPMYYTPASLIFRQADAIGYQPKYFGVDGMDGILTLEGFDPALAEGVMLLTPFSADAQDGLTVNLVEKYRAKYGEIPNQFAADGYDCVYAVYKAILDSEGKITADMSAAEICEELIAIFNGDFRFNGVTGSDMTWDASGQVSKEPKAVIIQNGEYVGMD